MSRPTVEHASPVWSPLLHKDIHRLDDTHKRALALSTPEITVNLERLESRRETIEIIRMKYMMDKRLLTEASQEEDKAIDVTENFPNPYSRCQERLDCRRLIPPLVASRGSYKSIAALHRRSRGGTSISMLSQVISWGPLAGP